MTGSSKLKLINVVMEQTSPEVIIMSSAAHYLLIELVKAYCELPFLRFLLRRLSMS